MSLDETLIEIEELGWLVNNLCQLDSGEWRVNLRQQEDSGAWFVDFGTGSTPEAALRSCMGKLITKEFKGTQAVKVATTVFATTEREAMVLRPALTDLLGLKKPPADFKRRV